MAELPRDAIYHYESDGKNVTVTKTELVRCRECRWWDKIENSPIGYCLACKHGHYSNKWEISIRRTYTGDFFCADGEQSGGDGDG